MLPDKDVGAASTIKVAEEVFIATALLHRENPHRDDFTVNEIVERVAQENIFGEMRPGVRVHAQRTGKIWPEPENLPEKYRELVTWAKERFQMSAPPPERWLSQVLQLRGRGRQLWNGEDPDQYVRTLREGWQ
jgi:hypothetical protein